MAMIGDYRRVEVAHPSAPTAKSLELQIKQYFKDYPDQKPRTAGKLTGFFEDVSTGQLPSIATGYNGKISTADPRSAFRKIQNVWDQLSPANQMQVQADVRRWEIEWRNRSSCLIL